MANVKLSNKAKLEELQAKLVLKKNRKLSQQEILDRCIDFADDHIDKYIEEQLEPPFLDEAKMRMILENTSKCKTLFKNKSHDEIIYG